MFGDVTGTLAIDPARPDAARVDVTIPVAKVTTASAGLTQHLLRPGKENIGFRATGSIMRSAFGLSFGLPIIGDEVKLEIAAAFQK